MRGQRAAQCFHGGGTFVYPLVQDYAFLSLEPLTIDLQVVALTIGPLILRVNFLSIVGILSGTRSNERRS